MRPEDAIRIRHMIDAAEITQRFIAGRQRGDLDGNQMLLFALVRAVEIIGEAASRVTPETRSASPNVPWPAIVAMRNRLIHAYTISTETSSGRRSRRKFLSCLVFYRQLCRKTRMPHKRFKAQRSYSCASSPAFLLALLSRLGFRLRRDHLPPPAGGRPGPHSAPFRCRANHKPPIRDPDRRRALLPQRAAVEHDLRRGAAHAGYPSARPGSPRARNPPGSHRAWR